MALAIYFVLRCEDRWIVRLDDRDFGHISLTAAVKAAIAAARASAEQGHETEVLVQRPDRSWLVSWTSMEDFGWSRRFSSACGDGGPRPGAGRPGEQTKLRAVSPSPE